MSITIKYEKTWSAKVRSLEQALDVEAPCPQPSFLRRLMADLFGAGGDAGYAERMGRSTSAFRRALDDHNSAVGRIMDLTGALFCCARELGGCPFRLLDHPLADGLSLPEAMRDLLGIDCVPLLADRVARTRRAIRDGLSRPAAKLHLHLARIAMLLGWLKTRGVDPLLALELRVDPETLALIKPPGFGVGRCAAFWLS